MKKTPYVVSRRTKTLLRMALEEDIGRGDVTSNLLIPGHEEGAARVIAREPGIFCSAPVLSALFKIVDPSMRAVFPVAEGKPFRRNQCVIEMKGKVRSILKAERTAINILGHLCGIATKTHGFVKAVKKYPVLILDTRKTMPLWREIEKYAVKSGGARNHRMGLYDAVFIKENHRSHADFSKLKPYAGKFEIEVRNFRELKAALKLSPRVILLDNFTPADTRRAVQIARKERPNTILESSGGITIDNVVQYAAMGVDWISVGSLTRSIRSIDFSLLVK